MKYICSICKIEVVLPKTFRDAINHFPNDTESHQRWIDTHCKNFREHYTIKNRQDAMKLTQEQRQEILDLLKTGITIGEIRDKVKQTQDVVCAVITMNIETHEYKTLRKESI